MTWRQEITRAHDMAKPKPMKEKDKRLVLCLLNPQNTKRSAWCFQDSNLHCQCWGFHCGRLCKNIHQLHQPFFSHGPSNSTRVKHYQTFIFLSSTHFIHAQLFFGSSRSWDTTSDHKIAKAAMKRDQSRGEIERAIALKRS